MSVLGNILWLLCGGLFTACGWLLAGLVLYITIIGIPFGRQCMKMARLVLTPFGAAVTTHFGAHPIANTLWLVFFGWEMALSNLLLGAALCVTIIGIPFGLQYFKMMRLSLIPFGAEVA
jgi:uncharacterized membrane protein YccF (DUF307 family)